MFKVYIDCIFVGVFFGQLLFNNARIGTVGHNLPGIEHVVDAVEAIIHLKLII